MSVVDLSFALVGTKIPIDHGYSLFSAICRIIPQLHGDRRIGVHPIRGRRIEAGALEMTEWSRLRIRLPAEQIAEYIGLTGKTLSLDGHHFVVGIPSILPLESSPNLASRLVTYRHALDPTRLEADVRRDLATMDVKATPQLVPSTRPEFAGQPLRRILRVKDKRIVGYALRVVGLSAAESIRLQEEGLGGRRRMGCGLFVPWQGPTTAPASL